MNISKTTIDKAGLAIAKNKYKDEINFIELEEVFDEFRKMHLSPLTNTTIEIQSWLKDSGQNYYIAQRLKRKPQIIRKLNRFSVRLSQLQDIGGIRIIVDNNNDVKKLHSFLIKHIEEQSKFKIYNTNDYREQGRDDSGYRALHIILKRDNLYLELQIRSRVQHYWAESIERTSVIYGFHLKEQEGDIHVLQYFKLLSDIFYEIEARRNPTPSQKIELDKLRLMAIGIIESTDSSKILDSYVNEDIIKTLSALESSKASIFNNWILIFDWNKGTFVTWDIIDGSPDDAIKVYTENENIYPATNGFEVVLIGSSNVATVRQTHSHYFGIASYELILENLDQAVVGFTKRLDIDSGAREILYCLSRKGYWGSKTITIDILKKHYCNILGFSQSLDLLIEKKLVILSPLKGNPLSLNLGKKNEIDKYI